MDPSAHFLLRGEVPKAAGATIYPIAAPEPVGSDDDKIGFTLDVTMRLDQESGEVDEPGAVTSIFDSSRKHLADSA